MSARLPLGAQPYRPPVPESLRLICATEGLLAFDKPSGLLSVPGRGPDKAVCAQSLAADRFGTALTVHRLDMDTSGLIIFARDLAGQRHLSRQFERRLVQKTYEALVKGQVREDAGRIDLPIAAFSLQRPLRHIDPAGQEAVTDYRVLERESETTRVELYPKTGRSHQLRLHMAALGHPILGDIFYGDPTSAPRLMLHASALCCIDPATEMACKFECPAPF